MHTLGLPLLGLLATEQVSLDKALKKTIVAYQAAITLPDKIANVVYIGKDEEAFNRSKFKLFLAVSPSHSDLKRFANAHLQLVRLRRRDGMAWKLQSLVDKLTEMTAKSAERTLCLSLKA